MEAKDIQIGDWVHKHYKEYGTGRDIHKDFQVTEIRKMSCDDEDYYVWSKDGNMGDVKYVEPIQLTAEILEKNGFVYNTSPFVQGWEQFGMSLYHGGNGFRVNCGINLALIIDSVHELQHALKLCGIDKQIVL